VICDTPLCD